MQQIELNDPYFSIDVIRAMPNPQQLIWTEMYQDYAEDRVIDAINEGRSPKSEKEAGEIIIRKLLAGGRGHYGPLEHPQIVFNVGFFPHSVMQQLRTHRVGVSFGVQSGRYSGKRIVKLAEKLENANLGTGSMEETLWADFTTYEYKETPDSLLQKELIEEVEKVVYLRPVAHYTNRQGKRYCYSHEDRMRDLIDCGEAASKYADKIERGYSEEHARGLFPFDIRQHFVMSCNVRSLMHLLDLRWKKDAQIEAQKWAEMTFQHFAEWCPEIAGWYEKNRAMKARLSP